MTYAELDRKANWLAHHLRGLGVGPGTLVGIQLERSIEMLLGLLAVWKAGGAYVPLDPAYPAERLSFMMADAGLELVLTQEKFASALRSAGRNPVLLANLLAACPETAEAPVAKTEARPENTAYVIYTSGSTGRPKGVQVSHRALVNFLASMQETPGLRSEDVLLAVTTLSFDIAALELFLPLAVGAQLVIADAETVLDPKALKESLSREGVTVMQATPVTWRVLVDSGWRGRPRLKALCGGEALSRDLADQLLARCAEVWNLYGPTETTIWSCTHKVEPGSDPVPVGRPIANTEIYLLDSRLEPVPVGSEGEMYIGGAGLADGYLNRPELTAERFVPHPFKSEPGARLYRTGDLGRFLPDGTIVCAGRTDRQVKIRGFRIELGEIESALGQHPDVAASVVTARNDSSAEKRLVAYYIPRPSRRVQPGELRAWLEHRLPAYMLPQAFVEMETFPLTPNGKIDVRHLPAPAESRSHASKAYVAPRTPVEQELAALWRDVLKVDKVGLHDNFFELGGHSLLAMQVIARLRHQFQLELSVAALFENPSLESFALRVFETLLEREAVNSP